MALGAISLDLLAVVIATSLVRARIPHRVWFLVHLTTYGAWAAAVVHGLFIGTDSAESWMVAIYLACAATVVLAVLARVVAVLNGRRVNRRQRRSERRSDDHRRSPGSHAAMQSAPRHAPRTPAGARNGGGAS
jgi:sulfoxide reductase heme-binding subunit YedZ